MQLLLYSMKLANSILLCFTAVLEVKGPSEPVLEGQDVTLECVDTESELNMSTVHFQRFSKVRSYTIARKCLVHNAL